MGVRSDMFSERLLRLSKAKGFNNKQFAEFVGISENAAVNYLKYGRIPEAEQIVKIASKFNVTIDWLLQDVYEVVTGSKTPHDCVGEETPNYNETENDILIKQTREILNSHTDYAQSLSANIKSFHNAIQTQKDLVELKRDNAELKKDFAEIKAQNMELSKSIQRIERSARFRSQNDVDGDVQEGNG